MKKKISLKQYVTEVIKLPKDLVYQDPVITLFGSHQLCVENYQNLLEYHTERIVIRVHPCKLVIVGKKLEIVSYTNDEMHISGEICSISYEK